MSILEHVVHTDLIKETAYSKIFVGRLDDSSKVIIKLLKHANMDVLQALTTVPSIHFPKILELSEHTEHGETELTVIEEYIEGDTLSELLQKRKLSSDEIYTLMLQLCEGISFLHQMNPPFIHRDIKPENLILSTDGILKIIDFNAARIYKTDASIDTIHLGTVEYAPPEQFGYSQTDIRSDIYSIGTTLHKIIYGVDFDKKSYQNYLYHSGLDSIIAKSTMYDPDQRYQSVQELQADLIFHQKSHSLCTPKPKKHTLWIIAILLLAVILIICAFWFSSSLSPQHSPAETTTEATTAQFETTTEPTTTQMTTTPEMTATQPETTTQPATTIETTAAQQETDTEPLTTQPTTIAETTTAQSETLSEVAACASTDENGRSYIEIVEDKIRFLIPALQDTHIFTFQLYDSTGNLSASIELRHNCSSPKMLPYNTQLRVGGVIYGTDNFKMAKNSDGTFSLSLNPQNILGNYATSYTNFTYTIDYLALPKLPTPENIHWIADNIGWASWNSSYPCAQFVYENGKACGFNTNLRNDNGSYACGITGIIQQNTGSYAIGAMALGDWTYGDSDVVLTDSLYYTIPEEKMPVVTGLHFEGTTLHITPVANANRYVIRLFGLNPETNEWEEISRAKETATLTCNLKSWFKEYVGRYPQLGVKVKTMSPDFTKAASDFSELCIYTP